MARDHRPQSNMLSSSSFESSMLLECAPDVLSKFLLEKRFKNDAMECTKFLLQCAESLPESSSISAALLEEDSQKNEIITPTSTPVTTASSPEIEIPIGDTLNRKINISCITPRGKFELEFHSNGLKFCNAKGETIRVSEEFVERLVVFPKPDDCYRTTNKLIGGMMVLLMLNTEVMFRTKGLKQICLQLPVVHEEEEDGNWIEVILQSIRLSEENVIVIENPMCKKGKDQTFVYRSETGQKTGLPFVGCYRGVNEGSLFPVEEGLLFFKPPMFLHRSTLHSIGCGRGASSGTRYVDMQIAIDSNDDSDPREIEFTNINREELKPLNDYIHKVLMPAMRKDARDDGDGEVVLEKEEKMKGGRMRSKRAASREARETTRMQMQAGEGNVEMDEDEEDDDLSYESPEDVGREEEEEEEEENFANVGSEEEGNSDESIGENDDEETESEDGDEASSPMKKKARR